jgi:uncharacterized protein
MSRPAWITAEDPQGVTIEVQVVPRARRSGVDGALGDALKVRVAAPPVEGAANEALIAFLATALRLRRRDIELLSGERSRHKRLRLTGMSAEAVAKALLPTPE